MAGADALDSKALPPSFLPRETRMICSKGKHSCPKRGVYLRSESWSFVFSLCFLTMIATLFLVGCHSESDQASEVLERRRSQERESRSSIPAASEIDLVAIKLTEHVIAEREEGSDSWYVSEPNSRTYLKVPFKPPVTSVSASELESDLNLSLAQLHSLRMIKQEVTTDSRNPGFLGAEVCRECHQERHDAFIHTAHHRTSGLMPNPVTITRDLAGDLAGEQEGEQEGEPGNQLVKFIHGVYAKRGDSVDENASGNTSVPVEPNERVAANGGVSESMLQSSDSALRFQMVWDSQGFYQDIQLSDYGLSLPVHVFTGSAKSGQTFLYWRGNRLYQSFVSYLTELDQWIPSPGYFDTTADYARGIGTTCLECHITYIDRGDEKGALKADTAIWGISCERCHGPGQTHVEYHRKFPQRREAKHISLPAKLSRQEQLDICSQCHSGSESLMTGKFDFRPGMEVQRSKRAGAADKVGGVHTANQLNRLAMSRCFQDKSMTCTTCHDPHVNQRGKRNVFSQSCLQCHQAQHCGAADQVGATISDNCIDCHMPTGDNDQMTIELGGGDLFTVRMIDHYIRVDSEATKSFLQKRHDASLHAPVD